MFEGQNFSLRRGDVVLGKSGAIGFSCTEGESVFVCFSMEQATHRLVGLWGGPKC